MSNPIADGALFYLTQQHRHGYESQPNLTSNSPFPSSADDSNSYPRSSSQRDSGLLGEARERWKSVLSRLSLTADTTTPTIDPDHSTSDIEESSTYELLQKDSDHRRGSWHYPPRIWQQIRNHHHHSKQQDPSKDDDQLPSTQDLFESAERNQQRQSAGEDNYFLHPFRKQWRQKRRQGGDDSATEDEEEEEQDQLATKPVIPTPRARLTRVSVDVVGGGGGQGDHTMDQDTMARDNWGKTFDKIKMIANIQNFPGLGSTRDDNMDTTHTNGRDMHMVPTTSTTLAPYYPPAFEPVFIALSRDEYGRKLVSSYKWT